ncbi:hypothetical protein [Acetivibrio sp. MSJd-27]|jgi:hypothetical protein|uniref:hypothetical protein n=1 Tax=Acetivibrio sp. MSJd-27 TaxID=2841523 RepID=UPI0015AAE1FD|nr:hypothetical protein [Acetivibrio sp. MSJd-27]MBU5450566.1 hypothetical protein [Acetivibrio sp. MSJd-27]
MPNYCIAGLSVWVENINYPFFLRRMEQYRVKEAVVPDLKISFSEQEEIFEPEGDLIGQRMGYRTYLLTKEGGYVNFDRLENTENRTALMTADPGFREVQAVIRDVEMLGGAPVDVRCFNMTGEIFRMALTLHGGLVVHSSSIAFGGDGILFSAPSGTGKSTHTRLWKKCFGDRVTVVNDDSPAVTFVDGRPHICGTPWSGKTEINENIHVPLRAVVFLEQAKENRISELKPQEAVFRLLREIAVYPYRDMADIALDTADGLLKQVPCYLLGCRPDEEAVQMVKNTLRIGEKK